jgi:DNA-directed RNA polymerase specialized sigma24 family protein
MEQEERAGRPSRHSPIELESLDAGGAPEPVAEESSDPERGLVQVAIEQALKVADPVDQEMIRLWSVGHEQREIAEMFGISQSAVSKRIGNALRLLRRRFSS